MRTGELGLGLGGENRRGRGGDKWGRRGTDPESERFLYLF